MTIPHGDLLYEGKAKRIYAGAEDKQVLVEFKNDATAFNAQKKAQLNDKGRLNCKISAVCSNCWSAKASPPITAESLRRPGWLFSVSR